MWFIKRLNEENTNVVEASDSLINPSGFIHDLENRINSSWKLRE